MKLNANSESLAQEKILILYLFKKLNKPVTVNELISVITNIKEINYFYLQQFLLDLTDLKYISSYQKNDLWVYEITESGVYNLELLQDLLPRNNKIKN